MLKSSFFSKKRTLFGIFILVMVISFLVHNNLIHKVWVDLITERQHKTQGFLDKISQFHGINLTWGQ